MYEEHEDGSFTLHMCEWYEQGRRLVGEYETLGDGSGFAVTDEWPAGLKVVVNHPLTRPDGTVMPGISRLRRFDWKVGPDEGLHADDYEIWERELREQAERDRFDGELRSLGALGDGESIFGRPRVGCRVAAHAEAADPRAVQDLVRVRADPVHVERVAGQACSVCALQCDGRAGRRARGRGVRGRRGQRRRGQHGGRSDRQGDAQRDRDEPVPAVRAGADADDVPHIVSFSYGRGRMPRPPPPRQGGE